MRFFDLRIFGLVGALALLFSFGLLSQATPAAAANPGLAYESPGTVISASVPVVSQTQTDVRDDSSMGDMQDAYAWSPDTMIGFHLERRLKLKRYWTAEDGMYCKIKGGGEIFVPEGATPASDLTC